MAETCIECGNDDATEGYPLCGDCLELEPEIVAQLLQYALNNRGL